MSLINNIIKEENLKESLIELKNNLSQYKIKNNEELKLKLIQLLKHEDPKIRKNVAVILGEYQDCVPILLDAYHHEETEFVKEAYLKGISKHDLNTYADDLAIIQEQLMAQEDVSTKHLQAQLKVLNPLILKYQSHKKKIVLLQHPYVDVILTTLPYYQFVTFEHVLSYKYKPVTQGVLVRTTSLYDLQKIRVYKDMLFPLKAANLKLNLEAIVEGIKNSQLIDVLDRLYDDPSPFYYRVVDGLREKNPALIKSISQKIFELFPNRLLNSSINNDIEIIIKEVKQGSVNVYLRLAHLNNPRFSYRKHAIANSINPYVAATLAQLAFPYMKDDAKVLDPFCGSGTMLIEKNIIKPSHFTMGLDIYGQGIDMAKKNAKAANQNIHFVHKDALRFTNNEFFDEIFTDMPTFAQMKDQNKLADLYDRFFDRLKRLVKPGGYIFIYTSEISLVRKNLRLQEGYISLEEHYEIPRGKNMFYFFIIKMK